jgi:uncharacterized protein (DUF1778 family)
MATRNARLDVRMPSQLKELIQKAALIQGQSVSDFAVSILVDNARRVIQQNNRTVLSNRDRDIFLKVLDAEEKPNEALKKAAERFKARHGRLANRTTKPIS